jgi:hypothetical protein
MELCMYVLAHGHISNFYATQVQHNMRISHWKHDDAVRTLIQQPFTLCEVVTCCHQKLICSHELHPFAQDILDFLLALRMQKA